MDDYLSKPIDRIRLDACLDRLLQNTGSTGSVPAIADAPAGTAASDPVDWEALLESIDGDKEFARGLVDAFIGTGDRELEAIARALGTDDAATLRLASHSLKGASANLRASAASSAAARLEAAADSGAKAEIAALADNLAAEVTRTIAYLRSMV
jgi:HPt (histidine-containing phosphotransfer) domain-containing protein